MDDSLGGVHHRLDAGLAAQKRCVFAQIALADFSFRLHEPDLFGSLTRVRVFAAGSLRSSRPSPSYSTRSRWRCCWCQRRRERRRGGRGGCGCARALPRAVGREAGRACGLGVARIGRACLFAPQERFASPCTICTLRRSGQLGPKGVRSWVRYVARAKCEKCIGTSLSIHHSSGFKVSNVDFDVAYTPH